MKDWNPLEEELTLTKKLVDIESIIEFTKNHRVEVMFQADCQYHCYIDYKEGDGTYGSGLTPLFTMWKGIQNYYKIRLK